MTRKEIELAISDLPNLDEQVFEKPSLEGLLPAQRATHAPRILLLYGSTRPRSFSRLLVQEAARLLQHLGITPGSVSLFALIHDGAQAVELVLDQAVWDAEQVQAHPLRNTATVLLSHAALVRFLAHTGHVPRIASVPSAPGRMSIPPWNTTLLRASAMPRQTS